MWMLNFAQNFKLKTNRKQRCIQPGKLPQTHLIVCSSTITVQRRGMIKTQTPFD